MPIIDRDEIIDFCLRDLLELQLHKFVADVEDIVELANKERLASCTMRASELGSLLVYSKIGSQLNKIDTTWSSLTLSFGKHKSTDIGLIKATEEVMVALEENMASLQSMSCVCAIVVTAV